ncbi:hypothetical protein WR25_02622 [Diploscapter pachys]|uniref:Uncharacterized protein n=1 Tax=Diploscapter pachys TaxID=2018661 RepID=A0A2A2M2V5_9BILA|nr:hypothetical protein WR25_02622 [Diploscapter pachys]
MQVASADPAMPSSGAPPRPRISTGLSVTSSNDPSAMNLSGVTESPAPRNAIDSRTERKLREVIGVGGGAQRGKDRGRREPAGHHDDDGEQSEQAGRGAEHAPHAIDIAPAHRLADQDRRGHAEAEHRGDQEEHDEAGVGRRRQRALAEQATDPDRVDRSIDRLQHAGAEGRKGEEQQRAADRAGGGGGASKCPSPRTGSGRTEIAQAPAAALAEERTREPVQGDGVGGVSGVAFSQRGSRSVGEITLRFGRSIAAPPPYLTPRDAGQAPQIPRHPGLVPGSTGPRGDDRASSHPLAAEWTPERVRGDGVAGRSPLCRAVPLRETRARHRKSPVTPDLVRGPPGRGGTIEPPAIPLAAKWTPERVRGDGVRGESAGVAEAAGERVAFLFRGGDALGQAGAFGVEVDDALDRQHEGGAIDHDLEHAARGGGVEADRFRTGEAAERGSVAPQAVTQRGVGVGGVEHQSRTRGHVELGARGADFADEADQPRDLRFRRRIEAARVGLRPLCHDQVVGARVGVPQLFGDEGHERVEQDQDLVEYPGGDRLGFRVDLAADAVHDLRLDER